jgi:hypothetical protein
MHAGVMKVTYPPFLPLISQTSHGHFAYGHPTELKQVPVFCKSLKYFRTNRHPVPDESVQA